MKKQYLIKSMLSIVVSILLLGIVNNVNAQTFNFTTAGATGASGPNQSQLNTAYAATNLNGLVTSAGGIQQWTVPTTGIYTITAAGAGGGAGSVSLGGQGIIISSEVNLTSGQVLNIVVGQIGLTTGNSGDFYGGSGGGGSFVFTGSAGGSGLISSAGGGGGGLSSSINVVVGNNSNGNFGPNGSDITDAGGYIALGGVSGNGGGFSNRTVIGGGPGAGWFSDYNPTYGGSHPTMGGTRFNGGIASLYGKDGGFGGGGASGDIQDGGLNWIWSGGGGGYSGGGAGHNGGNSDGQVGGGGGSFLTGSNQTNVGLNSIDGYITITHISVPPTIISFTPATGSVGTLITITGTNLGNLTGFTIGGVNAIAISNTGTTLVGYVMPGAVTGDVAVTTGGGTTNGSSSFTVTPTPYPNTQQGAKLTGSDATGSFVWQGTSIALSADGNTAIVGGIGDNGYTGAAWIYTRNGSSWSQQGSKLVGTGATAYAGQGSAVSISADGNTAIVGGSGDNNYVGAAWIFTRNGSTWTQQGAKLVGTSAIGSSEQGVSASMSADGNTAIVGGYGDNNYAGAAWIYTRSGSTWTQQGTKLVGTGAVGNSMQGNSVSMSADGYTVLVGGHSDNSGIGAAWIYTRISNTWTQQGVKLTGTGAVGTAYQGSSVSISADGNTALIGGAADNNLTGAVWAFTRSGSSWTQQGNKLVGTGAAAQPRQGAAVSLSADGNTAIIGASDTAAVGSAWVFTRSGNTWIQQGNKMVGTGNTNNSDQGVSVSMCADGTTAIVGGSFDNLDAGAVWVYTIGAITGNSISSSQTICSGSLPSSLSGSTPTGATGGYTYSWLISTTSGTSGFSAIASTNTTNYSPSAISQNTWFKRVVTSGSYTDTSAVIAITINTSISANSITSSAQSICSGITPSQITGSTPTGGDGVTYTYSWLSSTVSSTTGFSAIASTNVQSYTPAVLTQSTWFRRIVTSGVCISDTSAALLVTVKPNPAPPVISAISAVLLQSTSANSYQWYLNGSIISGENNQTLSITANGNYSVVIDSTNGCIAISNPFGAFSLGVSESADANSVVIYPNPATSELQITSNKFNITSVQIVNVLGEEVIKELILNNEKLTMDVSSLTKGVYFVRIATSAGSGNDTVVNKKIIVQ